ncbi:Fe(2+) transporter permease subunit FeoB [Endothiovibrio diazotrophicus]
MSDDFTIAVVGNPNCGKSTLFNALTGARQRVGNWPGVTVDKKTGDYRHRGERVAVVDLPGVYSIDLPHGDSSVDERIARDYVLAGEADLLVNIVDGSNLERNLYLTSQLLEMRVPMVVAVNMMDKAERAGLTLDLTALADRLGCPVVALVASREDGVDGLKELIAEGPHHPPATALSYGEVLGPAVDRLAAVVAENAAAHGVDAHWLALKLLEEEYLAERLVSGEARALAARLAAEIAAEGEDDVDILLTDARYGFVHDVVQGCLRAKGKMARSVTERIDRVVLNRALGIPIFLAVMYLMFLFTINIGGAFIDFFDIAAGAIFVDGLRGVLESAGIPEWINVVVADGLGGGIQTVATFIPVVGFLFLFLSVLEDSGYMTRAAFVMDRMMRAVGLPGKSFVPLIVGFGCNVPAIMATRTLENRRDRLLTVFMAPFMSCGARLPVYALFAAAFFPSGGQNLVFGLYLLGILAAVLTGLLMKNTVLRGESAPFVMEMPTYHVPTVKGVALRTWERTRSFIVKAGRIIVPMVAVLAVLNSTGVDGTFGNEDSDRSVLSEIGRGLTPAFAPMGVEEENWPATVGIFTGILAKEAVVGTLDSIYGSLAEQGAGGTEEEEPFSLSAALGEAFATIPANLRDVAGAVGDPLGLDIGDVSDEAAAAEAQEVGVGTFGAMHERFNGAVGAFAFLLFILLYTPCTAAIAAIHREVGNRWTLFVVGWTTGLAYFGATLAYQIGTFTAHPGSSTAWIVGIVLGFALLVRVLRIYGGPRPPREVHNGPVMAGGEG